MSDLETVHSNMGIQVSTESRQRSKIVDQIEPANDVPHVEHGSPNRSSRTKRSKKSKPKKARSSDVTDLDFEERSRRVMEAIMSEDKHSDREIRKMFAELEADVQNVVKHHFGAGILHSQSLWPEYESLHGLGDRDFWLQARIANHLADSFLSANAAPTFGLPEDFDEVQGRLEEMLKDGGVNRSELDSWRIQTIRVAALARGGLDAEERTHRLVSAPRLAEELHKIAIEVHEDHAAEDAMADVELLFQRAKSLALVLRSCRTRYAWWQTVDVAKVDADAASMIHDYGAGLSPSADTEPSIVLFGPVYKEVDGGAVVLRKGKVLCA